MAIAATGLENLTEVFKSARNQSDDLFRIIRPEHLYDRPIDARHRTIFYVGHLDGFDSIQICREGLGIKSPDPELDRLFQAGIDPDGNHLPSDEPADWPSYDEVMAYVQRCRRHVDRHLDEASEDVVLQALEHRLMHLETLAYMFHNLPLAVKQRPANTPRDVLEVAGRVEQRWCRIPAGIATLGLNLSAGFGWDNEFAEHRSHVPAFAIQKYSVTNGDYFKFMMEQGASKPVFWTERNGKWLQRGMFEEIDLPLDWPVYVTQQQATEYATHHGWTLPTEEQFHRAAYGTSGGTERSYPWGEEHPSAQFGNFDFRRWDPEAVTARSAGDSAWGVSQMVGNGWQWTSTPFAPFEGFQPRASYPGYSANFFDGEHFVMKGGSAQTGARLLRRSFRNWFRRDYPFMYATFRCVQI